MKKLTTLTAIFTAIAIVLLMQPMDLSAQGYGQRGGFIDENGDGFNDNAPDADGDGIPDFHDPDHPDFVDENGDGYNDNAPDADGDGIPNHADEDFVKGTGTGLGARGGRGARGAGRGFIDENADGFNDNAVDSDGDGIPDFHDPDSPSFVDENGDGYNDNARDHDGDGIPNVFDDDFKKGAGMGQGRRGGFDRGQRGGGTGNCDGTGPDDETKRGRGRRNNQK